MNKELQKLVKVALEDKVLSEREREILFNQAEKLGEDLDVFELYLENEIPKVSKNNSPKTTFEDGFDISNQELILRAQKWTNLVCEDNYSGKIEKFPSQELPKDLLSITTQIGKNVLGTVGSNFKNKTSFANPMNYVRLAAQITHKEKEEVNRKIKNSEIVELANGYLSILEMRASTDDFLRNKFLEFSSTLKHNLEKYNQKKNSSWLKKII